MMRLTAAVVCCAGLVAAAPASASLFAATYTGTTSGVTSSPAGGAGYFGNDAIVSGGNFVLQFSFDTAALAFSKITEGYVRYDGPIVANLTINGITATRSGNGAVSIADTQSGGPRDLYTIAFYYDASDISFFGNVNPDTFDFTNGLSIDQTIDRDVVNLNAGGFSILDRMTGVVQQGDLVTSHLTVGPSVQAVPEPATWAMLLVGFGMIGAAARYRRRSTTISFA